MPDEFSLMILLIWQILACPVFYLYTQCMLYQQKRFLYTISGLCTMQTYEILYDWPVWAGSVPGIAGGAKFGGGRVGAGREGGPLCDPARRDRMLPLLTAIFVFPGPVSSMSK